MAKIKWLETEYCGSATGSRVQPALVDGFLFYVLFKNGHNYVFDTIYQLHLYLSGYDGQYAYTCESEEQLEEYLRNA